ncbi:S41 family peptidase [Amycolatopsis sp. NPDC059657]|uniref:S41 family peptidase n=1 Tax=Amycolatopsis sp. NPDC059657 TaxID=3346899 RepID=UPI0036706A70
MSERGGQIDEISRLLGEHYVFPEAAQRIAVRLWTRQNQCAFESCTDEQFAAAVTEELRQGSDDKHLRVRFHVDPIAEDHETELPDLEREEAALTGYGIARAERLPGNVGYLDTTFFYPVELSGAAIAAAMTLLASTDALLIDVRRNRGGSPEAVALLAGYLLDERTHLNDLYFREGDRTEQFWSPAWVPGRRFGGTKPVWILTGPDTFSGAEDLSYSLQQLGRARTVGAATRGGAHPCDRFKLAEHLDVTVPVARAINPKSGSNWEGVGVQPDISAEDAFTVAYGLALEQVRTLGGAGARRQVADEARLAVPPGDRR